MNKQKGCLWLVTIILLAAISPLAYGNGVAMAFTDFDKNTTIESVVVKLELPEKNDIHSDIKQKIIKSVGVVAEKLLLGQKVYTIEKTEKEISQVLKVVFDRVLKGYEVKTCDLIAGEKTFIIIKLQPMGILIENVDVDLKINDVSDKLNKVLAEEIDEIEIKIRNILLGLSVEAFVWADDIVEPFIYHLLKWQLPGFEPQVDLKIGSEVKVNLTLTPKGKIIEDVKLKLVTHSLPRILSKVIEDKIEKELEVFHGLPVSLLEKYEEKVKEMIEDTIQESNYGRYIYLNKAPALKVDTITHLTLDADWTDYKVELAGEINMVPWNFEPVLHLTIEKDIYPHTTAKLQNRITLDRVLGSLSLGLEYYFGHGLTTGLFYRFQDAKGDVFLDFRKEKFGLTLQQLFPGKLKDLKIALNYYPDNYSKISLINQQNVFRLSFQHLL